ncbi:MAG: glycosyltransferase [Actinomycetota bacterium]|nr:glycosyltransferase [Actinomycetota bacterium]
MVTLGALVEPASRGPEPASVDVLIPTCDRPAALAVTLTSLASQTFDRFRVIVSDQGDEPVLTSGEAAAVVRVLEAKGRQVEVLRNLPRRGMAQQRQFLLDRAQARYVLYLDDDVILEPDLLERLVEAIGEQRCGFVGSALIGLSHVDDERPEEQHVEFWDGDVRPEEVKPGSAEWERYVLHNAANLYHLQERLGLSAAQGNEVQQPYKVAWVGGCVLYDASALREVGGFRFHDQLPPDHAGEEVVAQARVMASHGGCALLPSGAYHQELPTRVEDRSCDAPQVLL